MPVAGPVAQTIKQAKAAYKAKGQPTLTDKEKRQLDRAIELDRRAWRTKKGDKRKVEAAKKKVEKEKKQKDELEKIRLGTQRRCDRFGYKSSQMHLGAFSGKPKEQAAATEVVPRPIDEASEEDSFGDDSLDDETLLDATSYALGHTTISISGREAQLNSKHATHFTTSIAQSSTHRSSLMAVIDLESFWQELDSSTQIARDLASEESSKQEMKSTSKASSFSSGGFDLTIEDMEQLDPPKDKGDRRLMPPPPLPSRNTKPMDEFTMSQLEQFVDDDLQLTQPG